MFKAKMERILAQQEQDGNNSKSSKHSIKADKEEKTIAGMLQNFFLGKDEISKAIKENK